MVVSKSYFPRAGYRFLSNDRDAPITSYSIFELDESNVWNNAIRSSSPDYRKPVSSSLDSHKKSASAAKVKRGAEAGPMTGSLPVNISDWSKILKDDYNYNRGRDSSGGGYGGGGDRVLPHEFLARTRIASFSVHEGGRRTLKGRESGQKRNLGENWL
ncbi:hypothetical protein RHMOL_Rhmol07G0186900 [Rhododendron molle]|uniref:Uncharacterized protein n=1 Tax=Rhododendron molle TaxID=49168 RepID=A0ACC0N251_RHOML|nr:hypothetical protein RHMOL_Rhmol07G0186900 [Rhododendron molle]